MKKRILFIGFILIILGLRIDAQTLKNIHRHNLPVLRIPTHLIDKVETSEVNGEPVLNIIQLNGYVQIMAPTNKLLGTSLVKQDEPGNMKFSIYQKTLDDMQVNILMGDYFGYCETEDRVRYYTVIDDGLVKSDNKHTYGGYKPFYRTIMATYVSENEFRGL